VATLTSKGQITIPKRVRESLGLNTGDRVEFTVEENAKAVMRPISKKVDDVFGKLHTAGRKSVSVERMDAGIRDRARAKSA